VSITGKGVHFALRRLVAHLSKFYRRNGNSNKGYALLVDFSKFFDNIDHAILFDMLERHITDPRVIALTRGFVSVFGPGKSLGLGSQVLAGRRHFLSEHAGSFYQRKPARQMLRLVHGRFILNSCRQGIPESLSF
jgi:hypothetical protein